MTNSIYHDKDGLFKPGNPGGPGRPKREVEEAYRLAAAEAFSPQELTEHLRDAMRLAKEQNSTRGIVSVARLCLEYNLGKPLPMDTPQNDSVNVLIGLLQGISEEEPQPVVYPVEQ